jgi:hypothetical protein
MLDSAPPGTMITVVLLFAIPLLIAIVGFVLVLPFIRAHKERSPDGRGPGNRDGADGVDRPEGRDRPDERRR